MSRLQKLDAALRREAIAILSTVGIEALELASRLAAPAPGIPTEDGPRDLLDLEWAIVEPRWRQSTNPR